MAAVSFGWERLFEVALPAIEHVFGQTNLARLPVWSLGGATALMLQIGHRLSHDVDLFVPGTRLKRFTPAMNPAATRISAYYKWSGHELRFELPDELAVVLRIRLR